MVRGIFYATASGSDVSGVGNTYSVVDGTHTSLSAFVDANTSTQFPLVSGFIMSPSVTSTTLLPTQLMALGSYFVDSTSGLNWQGYVDGSGFQNWLPTLSALAQPSSCAHAGETVWFSAPTLATGAGLKCLSPGTPGSWQSFRWRLQRRAPYYFSRLPGVL